RDDDSAIQIGKLSAILACWIAIVLTIVLLLWGDGLAQMLNIEAISNFIYLIPIAMLFAAFQQILEKWLIRKKRFGIVAQATIGRALLVNLSKVSIGW